MFLAWVAVIERFAPSEAASAPAAPAELNTYALVLFLAELAAFGFVFVRLLQLVSPQGVARGFADSIRDSVEEKLRRRRTRALFAEACEEAGVEHGWFARGASIASRETGGFTTGRCPAPLHGK